MSAQDFKVKIEKGVPMPKLDGRGIYFRRGSWSEIFSKMERGDSFVVQIYPEYNTAAYVAGVSIVVKKIDGTSYRIWKIR